MSLQEEELVSSHAGQPEQASSLLDQIMAQTRIQPGSEWAEEIAVYCPTERKTDPGRPTPKMLIT